MSKRMTAFVAALSIVGIACLLIAVGYATLNRLETIDKPETKPITIGESAMVELGDGLWYNSETGIVYWWNGNLTLGYNYATTPSPYYAPNGLPYKYNPITKSLEEIE